MTDIQLRDKLIKEISKETITYEASYTINQKAVRAIEHNEIVVKGCDSREHPLQIAVTIQISLKLLNEWLRLSINEELKIDEELYLPPHTIIDFIDPKHLNAAAIYIGKEEDGKLSLCFENLGHAAGFVRFYISKILE